MAPAARTETSGKRHEKARPARCRAGISRLKAAIRWRSIRQRIGPHLEVHDLGQAALAAFDVEGRAVAGRGPDTAAFPAAVGIIDAAVHALGIEALRIRDPQRDELAV